MLSVEKLQFWHVFSQRQEDILIITEPILGLFVLSWMHSLCQIQLWQWTFFSNFFEKKKKKEKMLWNLVLSHALGTHMERERGLTASLRISKPLLSTYSYNEKFNIFLFSLSLLTIGQQKTILIC